MNKRTKRRVQGVAVFVVFLAMAIALWVTFGRSKEGGSYDFKESRKQFQDTQALNKAQITMNTSNISVSLNELNKIIDAYGVDKPIRRDNLGGYGVFIFNVRGGDLPEIQQKLKGIGNVLRQSEVVDTALVKRSYAVEEKNLESLKKDFAAIDSKPDPSSEDLRTKAHLIERIREAELTLDNLKKNESTLVYLTMVPIVKSNKGLDVVKQLGLNFAKWAAILFISVILVYYGTKLLMYLLSLMGVKGLGMGGVGSSYQYGGYSRYGGYANRYYSRYGYHGGKRKVKRIYKDKAGTPHEPGEEEQS